MSVSKKKFTLIVVRVNIDPIDVKSITANRVTNCKSAYPLSGPVLWSNPNIYPEAELE
jgi:hypothetical protein